jgi:hypothetical protein
MKTYRASWGLRLFFGLYMLGFAGLMFCGPKIVDPGLGVFLAITNFAFVAVMAVIISRSETKALGSSFREGDASVTGIAANLRRAEDRLDELERLKRRDMVTPEEYAAKRQEILKDL